MPTPDANVISSPRPSDERGSSRRLDDIGVETVLGAMIEQKHRSSRPDFSAFPAFDLDLEPHEEVSGVFVKAR
jgi:hypothetical protein